MDKASWEPIIGLEIHAELNTRSKLFSVAPNHFGDEPNINITEVCTGQPGALPVLNQAAVYKAVQFGCAIGAKVAKKSRFDRKSYFYPDSPRNFQITQYDEPLLIGGTVVALVGNEERSFAVHHTHLEDDAGMLKHFPSFAGVDYNRAGVPLIEIVSDPCFHSAKEAVAYAMAVKAILQYLQVSDCNMEEGSLRFDANISVRLKGETGLRNKVEIKNLNSFNYLEMALESEISRQIRAYTHHKGESFDEVVEQSTYRWDAERKETILMRRKEGAEDYRYFPEPDLLPIILTEEEIDQIRQTLPELPLQREQRYVRTLGLHPDTAFLITYDKSLADYFEEALQETKNSSALANWLVVEFAGRFKESTTSLVTSGIPARHVGQLVEMIEKGIIHGKIAKAVADAMVLSPAKSPLEIVKSNPDFAPIGDVGQIEQLVDQVIRENSQTVADLLGGNERAFTYLVGQVMKLSKGKASPPLVNEIIRKQINVLRKN